MDAIAIGCCFDDVACCGANEFNLTASDHGHHAAANVFHDRLGALQVVRQRDVGQELRNFWPSHRRDFYGLANITDGHVQFGVLFQRRNLEPVLTILLWRGNACFANGCGCGFGRPLSFRAERRIERELFCNGNDNALGQIFDLSKRVTLGVFPWHQPTHHRVAASSRNNHQRSDCDHSWHTGDESPTDVLGIGNRVCELTIFCFFVDLSQGSASQRFATLAFLVVVDQLDDAQQMVTQAWELVLQ